MSRSRRRPANAQKKQGADRAASRRFWGDTPLDDPALVRMAPEPAAMMLSLGDPPMRNNEDPARRAFTLVYHKAAQLAMLAATAAGLDDDAPVD
jgi:hypothetical protein